MTNAALGEELKNPEGRSVVKVSHQPISPFGDDSDSEIDSDEELDDSQDEFELDEVEGFKKVLDGEDEGGDDEEMEDGDEDEEDDEEDDDEEDDEDDSDFSEDEVEETNVLCALTGGKVSRLFSGAGL